MKPTAIAIPQNIRMISLAIGLSALTALGVYSTPVHSAKSLNATQETIWRVWSYSLAMQAATWGAPLVTMYALRHHDALGAQAKAKPNTIWRMENISTPELSQKAGYVTPNVNTLYGFGFMDLRQEPVILEVPDSNNRYYMVEIVDMWTNAFAYVGGKTTGYKGGKYALTGPGWKGDLPAGVTRIESPTPWVLLQPRVHIYVKGKIDLPGAKAILDNIKTTSLSAYNGQPPLPVPVYHYLAPIPVNDKMPVSAVAFKDPLQFWEILVAAMNENPPPPDQIKALVPMFKPLGITIGKPWDKSTIPPQTLLAMEQAAKDIGNVLGNLPVGTMIKGGFLPPPSIGNFGTDYLTRAVVGRVGLTANTPFEAIYWDYNADSNGRQLVGSKKYTMTFKQAIPYIEPGFWSITLYDAKNNYTVPNALNRYMLGSDTPDLKKNPDGSFTIYIQKNNPGKDKESNWLPAPPGPFYLIPRAYAPKQVMIDLLTNINAWPVPVVEAK